MSLSHATAGNSVYQTTCAAYSAQKVFSAAIARVFRLSTSASLGVLVTGGLIYFMCSLIAMETPVIIQEDIRIIEIVMPDQRDIVEQRDPIPPKPVDPVDPPAVPEFKQSFDPVEGSQLAILPTFADGPKDMDSGFSSGAAMAIFKVAPEYPRRAVSRGIEGFVDLMFDITPAGKTENIRVIYAEPEGYFENTSTKTLAKWKYKPAVEDGVAMAQKNQTTRIVFELDK